MEAEGSPVWRLFADWCSAFERQPLPADPLVLAQFIAANPAAVSTQRRRVSIINAEHRRAGHLPPGRAEAVRALVNERRGQHARRRKKAAAAAIARMPYKGWPTSLFNRRDAMLLVLSAAALPATRIAALRIGDVVIEGEDRVWVRLDGESLSLASLLTEYGVDAGEVVRGWLAVRAVQHGLPSTRRLAAYLSGEPTPFVRNAPDELPLLTAIDRWGATPLTPTPLGAASLSRILCAHLRGNADVHAPLQRVWEAEPEPQLVAPERAPDPEVPQLSSAGFARGIEARQQAARDLGDVSLALDDIEDRADRLLENLLALLDAAHSDEPQISADLEPERSVTRADQ